MVRLREARERAEKLLRGTPAALEQPSTALGPTLTQHLERAGWEENEPLAADVLAGAIKSIRTEKGYIYKELGRTETDRAKQRVERIAKQNPRLSNKIATGGNAARDPAELRAFRHPRTGHVVTAKDDVIDAVKEYVESETAAPSPKTGAYLPSAAPRNYPWEARRDSDEMRRLHAAPRTWLFSEVGDAALFEECIKSLKNNKAPGPDCIPNEVLKGLPPSGRAAVHGIFQLMWAAAYTPPCLKKTHTALMHKKGAIADLDNYRRLGLENTLLKLWTKLVTAALMHKAETTNMLRLRQAGFRPKRSTELQLEMPTMALDQARHLPPHD